MKLIRCLGTLASLITSTVLLAQTPIRQMEGVTEYRLDNGLQVLLAPNDLQARTYVNLVVKAGSAVQGFGEGGMAHLLEHMVFKGTPTTKDPMAAFNERSLNYNGTTNVDRTNYFASMNPNASTLNWYLGWLADAMTHSFIAKADLDREMTVVRNEFERAGSSAGRAVYAARMALAFPNHGYGRPTIGNLSDIENVPIAKLQAFYKTWYRPDNMVLVVTGHFDAPPTLAHIQSVFGPIAKPNTPLPLVYSREPVQQGVRGATVNRTGGEVVTIVGWRGAPRAHRDDAALDVVAHALANSAIGRFTTAMNAQNLGSSVSANHSSLKDDGLFDVSWQTNDASKLNTAQALLLKLVGDIAQSGVSAEELTRAQTFYATRSENLKNSADGFGSTLAEAAAAGDWRLSFWHRDQMQTTTIADTQRVASQYLVESNRVRASYIPQVSPVRAPQAVPSDLGNYVAAPSALAQARTVNTPAALQRFEPTANELDARTVSATLPVGTRMAMIARPAVGDAISGTLRLHWGNLETMRGQWAVSLMGSYLLRGTTNRSQKQLEDDLNTLQSTLSIQSGVNGLTLNFQTTRQHWLAFAALMQDVLRQPGFKEGPFLTWKKSLIATWQAGRDAPETLASIAMNRALYAYDTTDPRYLPSNEEAIEAMNKVSIDDVRAFWAAFAGASVSEFAAVGALDAAQIQSAMAKVLADWDTPGGAPSYQRIPRPLPNYTAKRVIVPTIDKPNAGLRATQLFTAQPFTREGYALQLASELLGASSSSRLFTRLRKEEGLTYGTSSSISASEDDRVANFTIQGTFAPQNLAKFETALAETLKDVETKGFTDSELARAKRSFTERVQSARNSDAAVAASLANFTFRSTPETPRNFAWAEKTNALALSVTLDDVHAAAKQLVDLRKAVVVVTGDFK